MSVSGLQQSVLDEIAEQLKKKEQGQFHAFKNIYPSGQYGNCDLSFSFRFTSLLYFEFIFYCYFHEMDNDATASSLGNGWAVSDNETALDELSTKDEANHAFRESLEELFLGSFLDETKEICNKAEDSGQLLKRFLKDGDDCRWRKEKIRETPRVTFYTLAKNSLVTSDCPWLTWQIRTNTANGEIVGLHLGSAEYLFRKSELTAEIAESFQKISTQLALSERG